VQRSFAEIAERVVTQIVCPIPGTNASRTGTGFVFSFFSGAPVQFDVLVTNKHVLRGTTTCIVRFALSRSSENDPIQIYQIVINNVSAKVVEHPDAKVDLAALALIDVVAQEARAGLSLDVSRIDSSSIPTATMLHELSPIEDIVVIGYPAGVIDAVNFLPVFRKGITATAPYTRFDGLPVFLIDAGIYHGSSGSPVFLYNNGIYTDRNGTAMLGSRYWLLGIVSDVHLDTENYKADVTPPVLDVPTPVSGAIPIGIGICIMASQILDFEPLIAQKFNVTVPGGYKMRAKS